jgi:ribose-phosphate pyrophosphokinase
MLLNDNLKVFSGTSCPVLAREICSYLDVVPGGAKVSEFPDSEKMIKLEDDVRGRDCFVIQSTCRPVDANLMELLIVLDCLRRASARRVTAVMPYFGYARQDRKDEGRVPITAKLVANLITTAGADRVLVVDLHAQQVQGFFDIPVDHLLAEPVMCKYLRDKKIGNLTVVSPDVGNSKIASRYAAALGGQLAIVYKKRLSGSEVQAEELIGEVEGKNVIMCDDMITTASTICRAAKLVKQRGAKDVYVGATHGVFAGQALKRLQEAPVTELIVTDTIPLDEDAKRQCKVTVLGVAELLGEAIKRIHRNESVSSLFTRW